MEEIEMIDSKTNNKSSGPWLRPSQEFTCRMSKLSTAFAVTVLLLLLLLLLLLGIWG